jgi:hypothetical protein
MPLLPATAAGLPVHPSERHLLVFGGYTSVVRVGPSQPQFRAVQGPSGALGFSVSVPVHNLGEVTVTAAYDADAAAAVPGFFYPPEATVRVTAGQCPFSGLLFTARAAVFVSGTISPEVRDAAVRPWLVLGEAAGPPRSFPPPPPRALHMLCSSLPLLSVGAPRFVHVPSWLVWR